MRRYNSNPFSETTVVQPAGMTPIEAVSFLKTTFPEVPSWTYLHLEYAVASVAMSRLCGCPAKPAGQLGRWSWEQVQTAYPPLLWGGDLDPKSRGGAWVGVIRVSTPGVRPFLLFSYLSHRDKICEQYLASTPDLQLLRRFTNDVIRRFRHRSRKNIEVYVTNGHNIELPKEPASSDSVVLPDDLLTDIDRQVEAFFMGKSFFARIGARYQRGFLFVGPPGTGKTLMMRRLVRQASLKYRAQAVAVNITQRLDSDELLQAFAEAESRSPALLLLDDVDSVSRETRVSRSSFLSLLDGMRANKGILIIGAANNPAELDPALINRPSRFDRVWTFPLPDKSMRLRYLEDRFPNVAPDVLQRLAAQTGNWSYAYLNELRTSAAILANKDGQTDITSANLQEAADCLSSQFVAGKKQHACAEPEGAMGFKMSPDVAAAI